MTWRKTTTVAMRRASRAKTSRRTLIWCRRSGRWLEKGCAPAQLALAWLLAQPQVVVIPGASSVEQLEFNVEAADLDLAAEEEEALTEAALAFSPRSFARTTLDSMGDKVKHAVGR